jgi:DNA-binding transcriptional LysR family regulator
MYTVHLSSIDLNLLVVLDALLETHSVKEAAGRLALSPSATSHALARLRELLGDPILVRAGKVMVPSARADRMRPRVSALLDDLRRLLEAADELDPSRLRRSFRVASTDYAERMVVAPLSDALADAAPGVDLYSLAQTTPVLDPLRAAELDLALGVFIDLPDDVLREPLFHEQFICVLRRGHPVLKRKLTLERYAALGHVLISPRGTPTGVVDAVLARRGLSRRVARTVASFLVAPQLVAASDYILTLPARTARAVADELDLALRTPPVELSGFDLAMAWHRRHDADPGHRWLREQTRAVAAELA